MPAMDHLTELFPCARFVHLFPSGMPRRACLRRQLEQRAIRDAHGKTVSWERVHPLCANGECPLAAETRSALEGIPARTCGGCGAGLVGADADGTCPTCSARRAETSDRPPDLAGPRGPTTPARPDVPDVPFSPPGERRQAAIGLQPEQVAEVARRVAEGGGAAAAAVSDGGAVVPDRRAPATGAYPEGSAEDLRVRLRAAAPHRQRERLLKALQRPAVRDRDRVEERRDRSPDRPSGEALAGQRRTRGDRDGVPRVQEFHLPQGDVLAQTLREAVRPSSPTIAAGGQRPGCVGVAHGRPASEAHRRGSGRAGAATGRVRGAGAEAQRGAEGGGGMTDITIASGAAAPEPPPSPGAESVTDDLVQALLARREFGKAKYGTELKTHNGRNAYLDARQEGIDLLVYLHQGEMQNRDLRARVERLEGELAAARGNLEQARADLDAEIRANRQLVAERDAARTIHERNRA